MAPLACKRPSSRSVPPIDSALQERIDKSINQKIAQCLASFYSENAGEPIQKTFRRALHSVLEVQYPIQQPSQLEALKGIGPAVRKRIEKRLASDGFPLEVIQEIEPDSGSTISAKRRRRDISHRKVKDYVPALRSASYAILVALKLESNYPGFCGFLTISRLVDMAQPYATQALTEKVNGTYITPLRSAIKTLLSHQLILKTGHSAYALTDQGDLLATRLVEASGISLINPSNCISFENKSRIAFESKSLVLNPVQQTVDCTDPNNQIIPISDIITRDEDIEFSDLKEQTNKSCFERIVLPPENQIILLVDVREIKSRDDRDYIFRTLEESGVTCEVRNLELGDFMWIARSSVHPQELVLPIIVERKREDDLISSIKDGRFNEQKWRLRRSLVPTCIYLVEECSQSDIDGFGRESFESALLSTQLVDGFFLQYTHGLKMSLKFLSSLTSKIICNSRCTLNGIAMNHLHFKNSSFFNELRRLNIEASPTGDFLRSISYIDQMVHPTYDSFSRANSKSGNLSIRDIFVRQLLSIQGTNIGKAVMIADRFHSLAGLYAAYMSIASKKNRENLLTQWKIDGRNFGVALSTRIYNLVFHADSNTTKE